MPAAANPPSVDQTRLGIMLVVCGLSIATLMGALMKILSADLHAIQITWFRFVGFAILLLPLVMKKIGKAVFKPVRPKMQIIRGFSLAGATVTFVIGATTINYADAIAILYAYPFLLTVLAVVFLGERVQIVGWIGVFGGFAGVLLVMRPDFSEFNQGTFFVFLSAVIVSVQMTFNRQLGKSNDPLVTSLWGATIAAAGLSLLVWRYWQPVNTEQLMILLLIAVIGAISQLCIVTGFAKAEASTLAPFTYFEIIAAVLVGLILFGTLPSLLSWVGIFLIAASGITVARSIKTPVAPRRNPKI